MGRGAFGTNQHLKSGGTLKLMVGDQPRFVANGSHITTSAPMGLDARIGEKVRRPVVRFDVFFNLACLIVG
jgi:hypothetical protein